MRFYPKLQNLIIHKDIPVILMDDTSIIFNTISKIKLFLVDMQNYSYLFAIRDINWVAPPIIPECLSSQLRTCSLKNYCGMNCELQFAEYVMQNSKVLRTMTIHSTSSIDSNAKHEMIKKLEVCPRSSSSCKLIFD
jgi:hypothetical protein